MEEASWGLMGRDVIGSSRRVRALGLGTAVRNFNDAAVPGLGGLSYGRQLLWSLLGIHVASIARERGVRVSNVEVANAIEAMACIVALRDKRRPSVASERIRGQQKLQGKSFCSFSEARKPSFYVSQPMRMSLVQPLLQLGLVEPGATRFNAYALSGQGQNFLELACGPYSSACQNKGIQKALLEWVMGKFDPWKSMPLQECLNPADPLSKEAKVFFRGLLDADPRRRDGLLWVQSIAEKPQTLSWVNKPESLTAEHWHELHTGALLFAARDAAIAVLETVEKQLDKIADAILPLQDVRASDELNFLAIKSQSFLDKSSEEADAVSFSRNCIDTDETAVLRYLIALDGRVLRLSGDTVVQGPAFVKGIGDAVSGQNSSEEQSSNVETSVANVAMDIFEQLPGISYRVRNLLKIYDDLCAQPLEKAQ